MSDFGNPGSDALDAFHVSKLSVLGDGVNKIPRFSTGNPWPVPAATPEHDLDLRGCFCGLP